MKQQLTRKKVWVQQMGIEPQQAIDVGAFEGDAGDNIHGCNSIGKVTALEIVKEFGSWHAALAEYHKRHDELRLLYPDISGYDFERLTSITTKSGKKKYDEVIATSPFTGVALALEDKKIKIPKTELMALIFEKRIGLAYSLKKMDDDIVGLPLITSGAFHKDKLLEYFDYYDITTLCDQLDIFGI
jgi:5'-3' exonuclease